LHPRFIFFQGKIDWEKLKATLGEDISFANKRYIPNRAGKSEALKCCKHQLPKHLYERGVFPIDRFGFNKENNSYICPADRILKYHGIDKSNKQLPGVYL